MADKECNPFGKITGFIKTPVPIEFELASKSPYTTQEIKDLKIIGNFTDKELETIINELMNFGIPSIKAYQLVKKILLKGVNLKR